MIDAFYPFLHAWDASRYPESYLQVGFDEAHVQGLVLAELRHRGVIAFAVDVGAKALRGRAYGALKRAGASTKVLAGRTGAGVKGMADIFGIGLDGRAVCIEVKKPAQLGPSRKTRELVQVAEAGQPTQEQLDFLLNAHRSGALVGVVWAPRDIAYIFEQDELARRAAALEL